MTKTIKCLDPNCDQSKERNIIMPDDAAVGDIIECPVCGAEMEIISTNPPQVTLLEEEK